MGLPKPTADHKRLATLAGTWRGKERMHPSPWDPAGGEAQGTTRSRVALDGFAVIGDYEQTRDGKVTFAGHAVYTFDPQTKEVVLYWFDTSGQGVDVFRGTWQGDRLTLESRNLMGHWRMSNDYSRPGAMTSRMEMSQDGVHWTALFDGSYAREG